MSQPIEWDHEYDVLIVGSGAGGMTAALVAKDLGLEPLVIEKSTLVGGTTAVSAGVIWIPNNPLLKALGYPDSTEEALTYLRATIGDHYREENIRAYLETGPELVRYLEQHSKVAFQPAPLPDYFSGLPGGKERYRALDPLPLPAIELGDEIDHLRPPHPQIVVAGMTFTTGEVATILRKEPGWLRLILGQALRQYGNLPWRLKHKRSPRLTLGNALVGRCLLSLQDRGIPVWRETSLQDILSDENGVSGVVARQGGRELRLRARRGVILAAGGFSANPEMRRTYLPRSPAVQRSVAPEVNTGDAIRAGLRLGAGTDLMDEAWWIPVYRLQQSGLTCGMFLERAFPGSIIVNAAGRRFTNDAANYDDAGRAMADANLAQQADAPCYFIFDGRFRRNYMAGPMLASPPLFDRFLSDEVRDLIIKAPDLRSLADRAGIDPEQLEATVSRFNDYARQGKDPQFHRGEEAYDRHYSDTRIRPNSTMAPIATPPFYAIPVHAGDIGTRGGLVTDEHARVQTTGGEVIPGLYAIGNSAASIMGRTYPGGGATIGPSMVFGARAAMQIAGRPL